MLSRVSAPARHLPNHRLITEAERAALRQHRERTGIGASRLLDGASDKPDGLTFPMVASWLSGKTKAADPAHLRYVLDRYAAIRDSPSKSR